MRHYFTILSHEIRALLYNSSTYVASVLFLFVMGFIFADILDNYSKLPQETPPAVAFFQNFWLPVLFMVPLLTMKSFAEERRQGTLETLLTTPVNTAEVVLGKFSAAYLFYLALWGSTLGFHYVLKLYSRDARYLDAGPLIGGYLFIAVSGLLFIAIGILASTLTRSQAVAGILTFTLLLGLIGGLSYVSQLAAWNTDLLQPVKTAMETLRIPSHVDDFTNGIVDTRQVFFYLTGSILALLFSILGVEAKMLEQLSMAYYDSFRAARWIRFINLVLQAILFLTLFAGLNYVALSNAWRFDLTSSHRHSLSPETRAYLEQLDRKVSIVVTISSDSGAGEELTQAFRDISGLLREYDYFTRNNPKGRIEVRYLDVYQNRREAEALLLDKPNQVILISDNNRRVLTLADFYETKDTKRAAFRGESTITAALLDVSSPDKKKIFFLAGHGEMQIDSLEPRRGLSAIRDELSQRNFNVRVLDLAIERKVPDDAALVIVASPLGRLQPFEEELLRNYLTTRAGRVILMLDPQVPHGLDNLLFDWGIIVYDDVIFDPNPQSITENNDMRLWRFKEGDASHITDNLYKNGMSVIVGRTRSLSDELGRSLDDGLSVRKLVATSPQAWGERSYRVRNVMPEYTPGQDLKGELGVMVISERLKPANLQFSVKGGRLAVFGTADLVTNSRIANIGNLNLFLGTVNWTVDRDTKLNIPVRPIQRFQLALSAEELTRLRLVVLLGLPGCVALLGLIVYWTRRN